MAGPDEAIHALAARQHGVFSRTQAREHGITRHMIAARVRRGDLVRLDAEVFAICGSAGTDHRDAIAAVLSGRTKTALSHDSAAAHWRLPGFAMRPFEITVVRPSRTCTSELAAVHTTTHLPDEHLTVVDGLVVTVPVRVLFDLAGRVHPDRLERLVDTAWRMRLVTGRLLRRTLAELAERGRPGIQMMRDLIQERGDGYRPPESNTEARFERLMAQIGIVTFDRQVDVGGMDWIGRVDFRDRVVPLIVEIDSATFHLSLTDQAADRARRQSLEDAGYLVVSVSDFDVWNKPRLVQRQVAAKRREAMRLLRPPEPVP